MNKQIGSADFTCFYHWALYKREFTFEKEFTLRNKKFNLPKKFRNKKFNPPMILMRLIVFYIPIPVAGFFLAYFQTTSA